MANEIAFIVGIVATLVLVAVLPRQIADIIREKNKRYKGVSLILFLGNVSLILINVFTLIKLYYLDNLNDTIDAALTIGFSLLSLLMGVLANLLYKDDSSTVSEKIDE